MAAIKKELLEEMEAMHGLSEDGLTYQQRCSRIAAYQQGHGEEWNVEDTAGWKNNINKQGQQRKSIKDHPLYGEVLMLTPRILPDKNRALYVEEEIGPEMDVDEANAGEFLYNAGEGVDRMFADYKVNRINKSKKVEAKLGIPKIGQEITFTIGKDLCPVCLGNDGQRGYIWDMPLKEVQIDDCIIRMQGLSSLIQGIFPEHMDVFKGAPVMKSVDGLVLCADISRTHALLSQWSQERKQRKALGLL